MSYMRNQGLMALCVAGVAGCQGAANDLSRQDAERAFAAVSQSIGSTPAGLIGFSGATLRIATQVDFQDECPDGGHVSVTGSTTLVSTDDFAETRAEYSAVTTYGQCAILGVTIAGGASFEGSMTYASSPAGSFRDASSPAGSFGSVTFDQRANGMLQFSGDLEGSCDFDYTMLTDESGTSLEGTFCGYDIEELGGSDAGGSGASNGGAATVAACEAFVATADACEGGIFWATSMDCAQNAESTCDCSALYEEMQDGTCEEGIFIVGTGDAECEC